MMVHINHTEKVMEHLYSRLYYNKPPNERKLECNVSEQ